MYFAQKWMVARAGTKYVKKCWVFAKLFSRKECFSDVSGVRDLLRASAPTLCVHKQTENDECDDENESDGDHSGNVEPLLVGGRARVRSEVQDLDHFIRRVRRHNQMRLWSEDEAHRTEARGGTGAALLRTRLHHDVLHLSGRSTTHRINWDSNHLVSCWRLSIPRAMQRHERISLHGAREWGSSGAAAEPIKECDPEWGIVSRNRQSWWPILHTRNATSQYITISFCCIPHALYLPRVVVTYVVGVLAPVVLVLAHIRWQLLAPNVILQLINSPAGRVAIIASTCSKLYQFVGWVRVVDVTTQVAPVEIVDATVKTPQVLVRVKGHSHHVPHSVRKNLGTQNHWNWAFHSLHVCMKLVQVDSTTRYLAILKGEAICRDFCR